MFNTGFPERWSTLRKLLQLRIMQGAAAVLQTVTGNAPITLTNAVTKAIKSLTQTGLCTQASTPTPSAPVDIKCNNGVLKLVDDELPVGFKRLASIKFDGDFWYETGEVMTGDDDVTMTLSGTVTTGQNVFGSYNGTGTGTKNFSLYLYGGGSTSNCYLRYGEQLLRPRFGSGERTITFGKSGTSGFSIDVTVEPETFTTVAGAFIGMLPNSTSPAYTGTIVGNILVGTRLKWIPCERESDGAVGYYEAVKGVFLEPVGTGTPVKGAYDFSLSHLDVVGTPETLTVTGENQTASVVNLLSVGNYADTQEIVSGAVKRNCGVIVLDGTETYWGTGGTVLTNCYTLAVPLGDGSMTNRRVFCTHFKSSDTLPDSNARQGYALLGNGGTSTTEPLTNKYAVAFGATTAYQTVDSFKEFLAAQYAAGTPVIVVYPLAEETTESVTPQPLTTAKGTNTVSVTAEVSPVALSCEYYQAAA